MSDYYKIALDKLGWQEVTMWYRAGEFNHIEDGHEYFASSYADGATVNWLLDRCKKQLLEADPDA